MNADLIVLADAANVTSEGKLNIMGEFNVILSASEPILWPLMVIVLRVECDFIEGDDHILDLRWLNDDGSVVSPNMRAEVKLGPAYRDGIPRRMQLIIPLMNAQFQTFGTYELEVAVNGSRVASRPLYVLRRPSPSAAGP